MPRLTTEESVGKPLDRVDGRLKVTGGARYAAEMPVTGVSYGVILMSTIARGRVAAMDTGDAEKAPGVRLVMTPFNAPKLPQPPAPAGGAGGGRPSFGNHLALLQDDTVLYSNQPIGVVVADTLEQATHAASLVKVKYEAQPPAVDLQHGEPIAVGAPGQAPGAPPERPEIAQARGAAKAAVEQTYTTPMENHNPMEPHATIAVWEGPDRLTVYDATQGIFGVQGTLARLFGIPSENVRCVCYFTGGGFGCKGSVWSHTPLAAMAAKQAGRPVKLALTRSQMFGPVGYRPLTEQKLLLAAADGGALTALTHDVVSGTSAAGFFMERASGVSGMLYSRQHHASSQQLVRIDAGAPTYMRAPGEASGSWALESMMDELSYALKMDPIALRLKNYAETDPGSGRPWSSKSLRECYRVGAERFGWAKRKPEPRSMRAPDGRLLGMGLGTATYPANRGSATALARLLPDGTAYVLAGSQDLGTGTYTIMTQIAADAIGLAPQKVRFELGDTKMPRTPGSGGSTTAATTGSAVRAAGLAARQAAIQSAIADTASPLHGLTEDAVDLRDGRLLAKSDPSRGEAVGDLVRRGGKPIEVTADAHPGDERQQYSMHSFGAAFAEVLVDPDLGEIRVSRLTGVYGVGTVLNAKTARSQLIGGMVFGVGMALTEQTVMDPNTGRVVNADLAEYHVPVNADIPPIDIFFVDEADPHVNPLGAKGIGEIGITGVVAAIGNAVYHATGVRVRDLPITLDKVLV